MTSRTAELVTEPRIVWGVVEDSRMVEERCGQGEGGQSASLGDARRLSELREEVWQLKQSLAELVGKKRAIAAAMTRVVEGRARVSLRQRAYEESKQRLKKEYEELQQIVSSNQRREDRLARVRERNFSERLGKMERECGERWGEVAEKREKLQETRRKKVVAVQTSVFPIVVEPLSLDDAGEEDYQLSAVIDVEAALDVDDGWVLSGVHCSPSPQASIVTASLPLNGDYSPYIAASEERRKKLKAASDTGAPLPPVTAPGLHPQLQPYLAVPTGLQFVAQLVELVADTLDTPLPHPLHIPLSILEYGNQNKRRRCFQDSLAKLDDDILYLCFSQCVPLSALSSGHTLSNLLALVTHSELGRQGAFQCHPDLATYTGGSGGLEDPENEPPSLYSADLSPEGEDSDSGVERVGEGEEEGEEWASVEVRRGRGRLEYESGYLDYVALDASRQETEAREREEGKTAAAGLFATISTLLGSTFTSRTNS